MTLLCSAALLLAAAPLAGARQAAAETAAGGARVEAAWILGKLARPAPMRTSFVEVRGSRLLKSQLRISGEYRRPDEHTLVRDVRAPYQETTTITSSGDAGQATIQRGTRSRTYSLERVPELANMQASFGAMLAGDRDSLERDYAIAARGTREKWILALAPRKAALAKKVRQIVLYGRGSELRCIETEAIGNGEDAGQVQRTLMATAARAVDASTSTDQLVALCRDSAG